MELPKRKIIRLKDYDYSTNGAYFVTICTHQREILFGDVGADSISARMISDTFGRTIAQYPHVCCDKYVVMPNHFHAIISIQKPNRTFQADQEPRADIESAPTVSQIVQSFKRYSTLRYIKLVKRNVLPPFNRQIWQRSFHDHIIRNKQEYQKIWKYIDENPIKWEEDCFYPSQTIE